MTMTSVKEDIETSSSIPESNSNSSKNERDEVEEVEKITKNETNLIRLWRVVVTCVLLATAIAVTCTTYVLLKDEQDKNFDIAFDQFSRTVVRAAKDQQRTIYKALKELAETLETDATVQNTTWPFHTMRYFENYARHALTYSGAEITTVMPVVASDERKEYLDYADQHFRSSIDEGHLLRYGNLSRLQDTGNYVSDLFELDDGIVKVQPEKDFYLPISLYSPPPFSYGIVNWDLNSVDDYANIFKALQTLRGEVLFTRVRPYAGSVGLAFSEEEHDAMHGRLADSKASHPHSFAFTAVHKKLYDAQSPIVAVALMAVAWDFALIDLLPDGVHVLVVIKNNCGQTYTYEIDGRTPVFLGDGDLHDPEFDYKRVTTDLYGGSSSPHTSLFDTQGHCQYFLDIYPTQHLSDDYNTKTPAVFAVVVASTFVLVAVVFVFYDVFVQRRNSKIIKTAADSNAIVSSILSSLFPRTIRDRLVAEKKVKSVLATKSNGGPSKPIAELFNDVTVMFADLVGFTSWSSDREPDEVFTLLETLYGSFDSIARRRKVFKVETIGDCYVAVAGLPEPRKDHALCMTQFAMEILHSLKHSTRKLAEKLGSNTENLNLRVGLHSGSVTAGVLRGDRARYQLFGDTMNTASRMESTGLPGKIQVSAATATRIVLAEKGEWLKKRSETVLVKGKGEMETYFIDIGSDTTSTMADESFSMVSGAAQQFANEPECSPEVVGDGALFEKLG